MQIPAEVLNIGADVAKDEIVVACSEGSFPIRQVPNQRAAILAFLKGLPAGSRIGVESTGTYHEMFAELAYQFGFLVFLLNPKDTHHYAKAVGLRGKTDRVDAELIARMIAHEHTKLHPWIPPTGVPSISWRVDDLGFSSEGSGHVHEDEHGASTANLQVH
jgi:transposase